MALDAVVCHEQREVWVKTVVVGQSQRLVVVCREQVRGMILSYRTALVHAAGPLGNPSTVNVPPRSLSVP